MLLGIIASIVLAVIASIALPGETGSAVAILIVLVGILLTFMANRQNTNA